MEVHNVLKTFHIVRYVLKCNCRKSLPTLLLLVMLFYATQKIVVATYIFFTLFFSHYQSKWVNICYETSKLQFKLFTESGTLAGIVPNYKLTDSGQNATMRRLKYFYN